MKRIIAGATYNTDTSTVVARYEYLDDQSRRTDATVYQTRGRAFFIVHEWDDWSDHKQEKERKAYFETISREGLLNLIGKADNIEIINEEILEAPPEAADTGKAEATLYVRLPESLKDRIETLAKASGLSVNSWSIRCLERCASTQPSE